MGGKYWGRGPRVGSRIKRGKSSLSLVYNPVSQYSYEYFGGLLLSLINEGTKN